MMTVTIHNVGEKTPGRYTYQVEVMINGKRIDMLIVENHDRADGWPVLLEQIAETKRQRDRDDSWKRWIESETK